MPNARITANYYQNYDADFSLDVPAEGYGGWKRAEVEISLDHTAMVLMHAWDCGTYEQFPGWHHVVEYIPRSYEVCRTVLPPLLQAVRESPVPLIHVVQPFSTYYLDYPGYQNALAIAPPEPAPPEQIEADETLRQLQRFREQHMSPGDHNSRDIEEGFKQLNFAAGAFPVGDERIAATSGQLFALCKEAGINHLIYAGFAIDCCLLLSPGGMADMSRHGIMCSALRQAVVAVENKETARNEGAKELGLWRVNSYGFVFDVPDFIEALNAARS